MMRSKLILIICLLSASLLGDAQIVLHDSMLTIKHAYYTTSADTSLAIIQAIRDRHLEDEWLIDLAEGDYRYATLDYTKALELFQRAYNNRDNSVDAEMEMGMLTRLMQVHDMLYNEAELATYIHKLRQKAIKEKDDAFLALADFTKGKRTYYHRKKQEGYKLCLEAVNLMKNSDYFRKNAELSNFYANLLIMYMEDGRYADALRMSLLQEEAILHIQGPRAKNRETLRYVYALRASLLAKAGRNEEANIAYEEWKKQAEGNCVVDKGILDYLIMNKHYQEAHDILHNYYRMLRSQKDNYSYRMISMLTTGAQVETALGNYDEAANHCQEIKAITDSLHIEMSAALMQKAWKLIQSQEDVKKKNILLNIQGVILLCGIIMGAVVLYYTRIIRHRNKKLLKALNSLEAYRNIANGPEPTSLSDSMSPTSPDSESTADENERLFVKLDSQITRQRLFLNPNFGRAEMARLIGVDKNRIGHIMSKYSDASNASVYINTKRVEYGAKLLLMHPEYTIAAIATECGMTNTVTFNRTFREVYGMTPSEYRASM